MFEQTFIATQTNRRERAIAFALIGQTIVVTGVGLLPLLGVEPLGPLKQFVALPPMKLARQPVEQAQAAPSRSAVAVPRIAQLPVPSLHSDNLRVVALEPMGIPGPLQNTSSGTAGVPFAMPMGEILVAPPVKPAPKPSAPVRLTSTIAQSQLIYGPKPAYPRLAVAARSEGTVKLQAIISREGKIENLRLVNGPALLVSAAIEAVRTWRYKPLLLNGEPVEVITEIDVIFNLR